MLFRLALAAHLACAFGATAVFWIPIAASKGGPLHRAAGRLYVRLIYLTALTGAPLAAALFLRAAEPGARRTAAFLAYLIVILVMPAAHGTRVIRDASSAARPLPALHAAMAWTAIAAGVALFGASIAWGEWHYGLVSPIGPVMGVRALLYSSRLNIPGSSNREYSTGRNRREEHMVAMVVSGIAVHTALLVFGIGRTLGVPLSGAASYVPWVLPAVIGLPLLLWGVRRERVRAATSPSPLRTSPRP